MRLVSLTINKFRRVKPCTLEFADDLSVLLGKNGAGKTTLLKLIVAVCKFDFTEFREDLDVVAHFQFNQIDVMLEIAKTQHSSSQEDFPIQIAEPVTAVKVVTTQPNGTSYTWNLASGQIEPSAQEILYPTHRLFSQLWFGLTHVSKADGLKPLLDAWLKIVTELSRFDESLGFFEVITAGRNNVVPSRIVINDDETVSGFLVPGQLREVWRTSASSGNAFASTTSDHTELLRQWAKNLSWKNLSATIGFREESQGAKTYSSIAFRAKTPNRVDHHDDFSFGQKRFLSFLYYVASHDHLLIVDELANGLHHDWIEICFAEMKGKQTIMSSQNPLVFDHLEFSDASAVSKALILCSQNEQGDMIWENMHRDSADHFYTSYQAGIRLVSEILREQNLW